MDCKRDKKNILIVNQHGENRGDEAAMRAMFRGLEKKLREVKFTLIVQFQDPNLQISFDEDVELLHMKMPYAHFLKLMAYALAMRINLKLPFLLTQRTERIIESFSSAHIVISAPGGPYFGDIYFKHELVHWFYIWLAWLYKKPLFLYATSAGPFKIKLMNLVRRYLYRKFDILCVREAISRRHLQHLLGNHTIIHLTADSALQDSLEPFERAQYFKNERAFLSKKYLVSVSAIEYKYPGESNVAEHQAKYTHTILKCLNHIATKSDCHFMLFPQLYGRAHSDVPYLKQLGSSLSSNISWEIVEPNADSDMQRRLFGMTDLCIASRYHPQIFAASSDVPGICIYYEHKALGFMSSLGLKDFAFDIRNLDPDAMCAKLDEAMERHDELSALMKNNIIEVQKQAIKTTQLAAAVLGTE